MNPPNAAEFADLLQRLIAVDNAVRHAAEATYTAWKQAPDALLSVVLQVMMNSNEETRSVCVILLRTLLVKASESVWDATSPATRTAVCNALLVADVNEKSPILRHKMDLLIAELGAMLITKGEWTELVPFLQQSFTSPETGRRESALTIFGELAATTGQFFAPHYPLLKSNLETGLCDADLNVRIAALLATCNFLQGFFKPEQRNLFLPLGPLLVETVKAILTANREAEAQSALKLLVQIAEYEPLFMKDCVGSVVETMLAVANAPAFEEDTQRLACEVLLTLAESKPAMMRKIPHFSSALITLAFKLMLSLDDIPLDEWNQQDEEEDVDNMENYDYGEEYLNRLSMALRGRTLVPQFFPIVSQMLVQQDWKHRYCAAMGISIIGEGCVKTLNPHLSDILSKIVPLLTDPHPKVRWAACTCIGQMATDFGPKLQKKYHQLVLPALEVVMDDVDNPRTRGHAAAALVNFVELCNLKLLAPYVDPLLRKLYALIQTPNLIVQYETLLAVAAIATVTKEDFTNFHDVFMPPLLHIVQQYKAKEQKKVRGLAIEVISIIGVSVGKAKFNGVEVMNILMRENALVVDYDDPQRPYIQAAMVRLCRCLKKEFAPFVSTILPQIMETAEKSDIVVADSNPDGQPTQEGWEFVVLGDKCVGVRTASLEEKATACDMLVSYAEELGGDFFPYVDKVLKIMLPLLKFYYIEDVRESAAQCMAALVKSAYEHTRDSGAAAGADVMYARNIFNFIFPTLIEAMEKEMELQVLNEMLTAMIKCLDIVGEGALNTEQLEKSAKCAFNLFQDYVEFMESQNDKDDDVDEEEEERLSDEITIYEDVLANIADVVGRVIKFHGKTFLPYIQPCLKYVEEFIKPSARVAERHIALCIVDDMVEFGGQDACALLPMVMPIYLQYLSDEDPAIRQASAWGIGIFARVGLDKFLPYLNDSLAGLHACVSRPDARTEEFQMPTDNAISAIGWICATFSNQLDLGTILPAWLQYLPVTGDDEESIVIYNNLCNFIEKLPTQILGPKYEHLPKVVDIFGRILNTEFVDEELTQRIASIIKGIATLPAEVTTSVWTTISPEARETLGKFFAS